MVSNGNHPITLELSTEQAQAVYNALEIYLHLGIGDVQFLREPLADGTIPKRRNSIANQGSLSDEECDEATKILKKISILTGHNSCTYGIGNKFVALPVKAGWGVKQVVGVALQAARNNEYVEEIKCSTMFEDAASPVASVKKIVL